MRQLTGPLMVTTLLLVAATLVVDGAETKMSQLQGHNAKRVMAKLQNVAQARAVLSGHANRAEAPTSESLLPEKVKARRREAAKKRNALNPAAHNMEAQQAASVSGSGGGAPEKLHGGINAGAKQFFEGAEHCNSASKFRVLETRFHDVCSRTDFSFVTRHWMNLERANSAYDNFCTSACAGTINDLLAFTDGHSCFHKDTLDELRLFSAMCQLSTSSVPPGLLPADAQLRCGAEVGASGVFSGVRSTCWDMPNKAMCDTDRVNCQWSRDENKCTERITQQKLEKECTTCYQSILDVVSGELNPICAKHKGQFCLPKSFDFQRIMETDNFQFSDSAIGQICGDEAMLPCFRQQNIGFENRALSNARNTYKNCVEDGTSTQLQCQQAFENIWQATQENNMFWNTICLKTANTTGTSCHAYTQDSSANNGCPSQEDAGTCAASCTADTAAFLNNAGCCTPLLSWKPHTAASDFPGFDNAPAIADSSLSRQSSQFVTWNVDNLKTCGGVTTLPDQTNCPNPTALSEAFTLFTQLNHTRLVAIASQFEQLVWAAKLDLGKAAGVPAFNVRITFAKTTVDGVEGTNIELRVVGTPKAAADALALLKATAAAGLLRTENVDKLIRHCKECKPATLNSILSVAYPAIPGAPTDECGQDAFINDYKALIAACENTDVDAIFSLYTDDFTVANAAWKTACDSQCLTKFKELRAKSYGECIPVDVLSLGDLMNVGCSLDNSETRRCGAVLSVMAGMDCASLTETDCTGTKGQGHCRWNSATSQCKDQFSSTFLEPLCNGGCISRMAATIGMNSDGFGKEAKLMDNLFCSHDNGTLCLPLIQSDLNTIDESGLTASVVNGVCTTRSKLRCMKRVFGALAADNIGLAELDFYHCVETVLDDPTVSHDRKIQTVETNCIENGLAATLSAVDQTNDLLNNMCSKNENGAYCMAFPDMFASSTCLQDMLHNNVCPSTCVSEIDTYLTQMGCCAGNLQQVHGFVPFANLPPEDIPEFETFEEYGSDSVTAQRRQQNQGGHHDQGAGQQIGFGGPGFAMGGSGPGFKVGAIPRPSDFQLGDANKFDALDQPKWYYMANYHTCVGGSHRAGDLVYKKCKKQRGTKTEARTLDLGVAFDSIASTSKKQARVEKKLKMDLALKQGCSADDYPSFGMKPNPKNKINLGPAPKGGPRRQTTTSDAASNDFSVQTEDNEDTQAAIEAYDKMVADGTLTLSSLIGLIKNECDNCTATGTDYTSVNTVATADTITATTAGSGSSSSGSGPAASTAAAGATTTSTVLVALAAAVLAALMC